MNRPPVVFAATLLCVMSCFSYMLLAQAPQVLPATLQERMAKMSFFITSVGKGNGGNLGGLAGADAYCQMVAQTAGAPASRTWHAYLSTQASGGQPAVNARDRIGKGPWVNSDGAEVAANLAQLHGDDGQGSIFNGAVALTEKGRVDQAKHDILTGSQADGRAFTDGMDHTCGNWTSNGAGSAWVGHSDRSAGGRGGGFGGGGGGGGRGGAAAGNPNADRGRASWNSSHGTPGCSQENLASTGGGAGFLYCFAIN